MNVAEIEKMIEEEIRRIILAGNGGKVVPTISWTQFGTRLVITVQGDIYTTHFT